MIRAIKGDKTCLYDTDTGEFFGDIVSLEWDLDAFLKWYNNNFDKDIREVKEQEFSIRLIEWRNSNEKT